MIKRRMGVEQAQALDDQKHRDDQQDVREHLGDEQQEAVGVAPRKPDSGDGVSRVDRDRHAKTAVEIAATLKLLTK